MDGAVLRDCLAGAFEGRTTFPETVARMVETGVERYAVDLTRLEKTHYGVDGSTHREPIPLVDPPAVPAEFSAEGVRAAIAASRRGEIGYPEFLRAAMLAGTTSYVAYLAGRKVVYTGRNGDFHVEPFPAPPEDRAMRVGGILETALYVADPRRAADIYRRLFDFPTLLETERLIALGVAGRNVLLLFAEGGSSEPAPVPGGSGTIPPHGGRAGGAHFAFAIAAEDVEGWRGRLESEGVAIEGEATWPGGARSLYFRDPDGNLAELMTPGFWKLA